METIENWVETVKPFNTTIKGTINGKETIIKNIIFHSPAGQIRTLDGSSYQLGKRSELINKKKKKQKVIEHQASLF